MPDAAADTLRAATTSSGAAPPAIVAKSAAKSVAKPPDAASVVSTTAKDGATPPGKNTPIIGNGPGFCKRTFRAWKKISHELVFVAPEINPDGDELSPALARFPDGQVWSMTTLTSLDVKNYHANTERIGVVAEARSLKRQNKEAGGGRGGKNMVEAAKKAGGAAEAVAVAVAVEMLAAWVVSPTTPT